MRRSLSGLDRRNMYPEDRSHVGVLRSPITHCRVSSTMKSVSTTHYRPVSSPPTPFWRSWRSRGGVVHRPRTSFTPCAASSFDQPSSTNNDYYNNKESTQTYDIFSEQIRLANKLHRDIGEMQRRMETQFQRTRDDNGTLPQQTWTREHKNESGNSRIYYSESYTVVGGGGGGYLPTTPLTFPSPLVLIASVFIGFWAATTAAFAKKYHLTTYRQDSVVIKLVLVVLWPLWALASASFREQLRMALRPPPPPRNSGTGDGSGGGGGAGGVYE